MSIDHDADFQARIEQRQARWDEILSDVELRAARIRAEAEIPAMNTLPPGPTLLEQAAANSRMAAFLAAAAVLLFSLGTSWAILTAKQLLDDARAERVEAMAPAVAQPIKPHPMLEKEPARSPQPPDLVVERPRYTPASCSSWTLVVSPGHRAGSHGVPYFPNVVNNDRFDDVRVLVAPNNPYGRKHRGLFDQSRDELDAALGHSGCAVLVSYSSGAMYAAELWMRSAARDRLHLVLIAPPAELADGADEFSWVVNAPKRQWKATWTRFLAEVDRSDNAHVVVFAGNKDKIVDSAELKTTVSRVLPGGIVEVDGANHLDWLNLELRRGSDLNLQPKDRGHLLKLNERLSPSRRRTLDRGEHALERPILSAIEKLLRNR